MYTNEHNNTLLFWAQCAKDDWEVKQVPSVWLIYYFCKFVKHTISFLNHAYLVLKKQYASDFNLSSDRFLFLVA
jgi:hypothetical protein